MKKFLRILATLVFLSFPAAYSRAADVYYSQTGAGTQNGTSAGNAYSAATFNVGTGCAAGNTLHLVGTFTTELAIPCDGSAGNFLMVLFELNAKFSAATWPNNSAILGKTNGNYIVVDGGSNGIIEATANGTGQNQNDFFGIHFATCNHCEVKNVAVSNIYVRRSTTDLCTCGNLIEIDGGSNNRIDHNIVHDAVDGIHMGLAGGDSNNEMDHNVSYHTNWTYGMAKSGSTNSNHILFHDNEGYDWANWDDTTGSNAYHHNGIHFFNNNALSGGTITDLQYYNNYFHGLSGVTTTAMFFMEVAGDANVTGNIFNNLLVSTDAGDQWNNSKIFLKQSSVAHFIGGVYNNTFYNNSTAGQDSGFQTDASNIVNFTNNLVINNRMGGSGTTNGNLSASNNWYYLAGFTGNDTFTQWKMECGCDANSSNAVDPNINTTTFVPNSGSGVIGFGANLTSLNILALDGDKNGSSRPASGGWTNGVYNSGGSSGLPGAASGLAVVIQ